MQNKDNNYPSFLFKNSKEIFDQIDKDKDQVITQKEFNDYIDRNHLDITPEVFKKIFHKNSDNENYIINRKQFIEYIKQENKKLKNLFNSIDQKNKGYIDKKMLAKAFKKYDFDISESQIKDMLQNFGDDTAITYKDFLIHYHSTPYLNPKQFLQDLVESTKESHMLEASNSPLITLFSGGISGAVSRTITAPIDRIKVIMQASNEKLTIRETIKQIYKKGNVLAFYKGNGTNVTKIMPETAIKFYTFDYVKNKTAKNTSNPLFVDYLISGACAGLMSQTLIYPLEITKTRLALAENKIYAGIFDCMRKIVKFEGFLSLYKGLNASLMGIIPYSSVDLALFHLQKSIYYKKYRKDPNSMHILLFGSSAGLIAQFVAYPFVVFRTRLQSQGLPDRPIMYSGFTDCIKQTYQKEGFKGFYRGLLPNYMKSIPAIAINYMIFEKMRKVFRKSGIFQLIINLNQQKYRIYIRQLNFYYKLQ